MLAWLAATALACDVEKLEAARTELAKAPNEDLQRRKLLGALGQACTFAPGVADAVKLVPSASATDAFRIEAKAATNEVAAWTAACPGGKSTLDTAIATTGALRRDALWVPCDLERFHYVTRDELALADGYVILSVLLAKHFQEQRVPEFTGIPLLRALAGLAPERPPTGPAAADVWAQAREAASIIASTRWDGLDEAGWLERAGQMVEWCQAVRERPVGERQQHKQVEYDVCAQAGRATENANASGPPHVVAIGSTAANLGYWGAASTAYGDRALLQNTTDTAIKNAVAWYVQQIESGALPLAK